jgi:hypothetical protein
MKRKTADWVRLANTMLDSRDALRGALHELQAIVRQTEDAEVRARVAAVLATIGREIDRLRAALKGRRDVRRAA